MPAIHAPNVALPAALREMTARNWLNVASVVIAMGFVIAAQYGIHPIPGLDVAHTQTAAWAFVAGALLPGSPIGRVLDYVASLLGGPPAPAPTLSELEAAKDAVVPGTPRTGGRAA